MQRREGRDAGRQLVAEAEDALEHVTDDVHHVLGLGGEQASGGAENVVCNN